MPKIPRPVDWGRQQMILIARRGGFPETKGNAIATYYLFQYRNFRIRGVSIFRNL